MQAKAEIPAQPGDQGVNAAATTRPMFNETRRTASRVVLSSSLPEPFELLPDADPDAKAFPKVFPEAL